MKKPLLGTKYEPFTDSTNFKWVNRLFEVK